MLNIRDQREVLSCFDKEMTQIVLPTELLDLLQKIGLRVSDLDIDMMYESGGGINFGGPPIDTEQVIRKRLDSEVYPRRRAKGNAK